MGVAPNPGVAPDVGVAYRYNPVVPESTLSAVRWRILALLFFATTINYLDRILFSVLIPVIRDEIHLSDQGYGNLTGAFTIAYTVGFPLAGKFIDRFGTRMGYAVSIVWWSLAAAFVFMLMLVLSANLFADAVRDAFDPRIRGRLVTPAFISKHLPAVKNG